ncbi:MAG: hypothetical protein A2X49_05935 [Lentisphaerae bacterium GWF2_52_8]|nr:MAG: hypothetical protein A2X49_05935 [Lentisphaerae bacterium GWF2_52_8]
MDTSFPVLGFDIGGTKIAVCLGDSKGKILGAKRVVNKDRGPDEVIPELVSTGKELLSKAGLKGSDLRAIGIGSPAPMDIPNGLILCPTNMKKWTRVPIRDIMAESFGVKAYFDNDANAAALAEWIFGAGKGCHNMIYLTMSTGIGGGIIANGHLLHGKSWMAGENGHVVLDINGPKCNCGLNGCYEAFCGGVALANRMQRELAGQPGHPIVQAAGGKIEDIDVVALVKAVRAKDPYSLKLWDEMCMRNAQAIGIFLNTFNPEKIVLGTIALSTGDLFMKPLKEYLPRFCWPEMLNACDITVSGLGSHIGEYSGICVALNSLYEEGKWQMESLK